MADHYGENGQNAADPAEAFERLRGEVALLRRAVEGLTAARESIDIPDYEPTLARTETVLGLLAKQVDAMRKSPAMTLTPETMGSRLNASVTETVNAVRGQTQVSKTALDGAVGDLRSLVASARRADEQKRWLIIAGGGGIVAGVLLYAVLAGPFVRLMPTRWQWPERMATRALGEQGAWEAGQRLMQTAAPESWRAIVATSPLAEGNREAVQQCREAAEKANKPVRCTIEVKPDGAADPPSGR
ncbi:DUF6118 family protein [Sphingobium aromaticiconvertens]|uniref:DUF6118 family protein n=1 Tax=Sphingobium aromaticiconvertens TaxID=365341 RepID=UPI0030188A0D